MSVPNRMSSTARHGLGALLASSFILCSLFLPSVHAQEIGPQLPQKKPMQQNVVTKAIIKLKNKKNADADPSAEQAGEQPAEEKSAEKPEVTIPTGSVKDTEPGKYVQHPPLLNQPPLTNAKIDTPQIDSANPPSSIGHPRLDDPANPLGFSDAENKLKRYITLVDAKRFEEAKPGLVQLRQFLIDLTEAHIGLFKTLNQMPSARGQAELEKELALEFAQLRDRAMMETAKVYISEKDYAKAVKELTEVVKSQPKSKMGLRSYEILQEIGFTEKLQLTQ